MLNVVLYEPEIPQNAGNIARLCAASGAKLHLIEPLGFFWDDRHLRRAGLDYWELVNVRLYSGWQAFLEANHEVSPWLFTTKGGGRYSDRTFLEGDFLVFGPETRGLPDWLLQMSPERCLRLPMRPGARSLNLANTVAVAVYEALRQASFPGLV